MAYLRLYNQELDTSVEQQINDNYDIDKIKRMWRHKYGKIYDKCTIDIIGGGIRVRNDMRRIVNTLNGNIYDTKYDAAKDLKLTTTTIYNHLSKRNGIKFEYLVKYEGE